MSVAIMKFRAGENGYAVAAGCVENVGPARQGVAHLSRLLEADSAASTEGVRTLRISSHGKWIEVVVDGPVEVVELAPESITPCRTSLDTKILGFARLNGDMYALLDADRLIELATGSSDEVKCER